MTTPLVVEQEESFELDRELRKCREEILRLVERYEELRERQAKTQQNLREMKRDWRPA